MPKNKSPNFNIIDDLKQASLDAFGNQHYLESAIIIFQTIEFLLRMAVKGSGRGHGVSEENIKTCSDDERSFSRLVLYLDLIKPDNGLSEKLLDLNKQRNSIVHRLFYEFDSFDSLKDQVEEFCLKGARLNEELRDFLGVNE